MAANVAALCVCFSSCLRKGLVGVKLQTADDNDLCKTHNVCLSLIQKKNISIMYFLDIKDE